MNTKLNILLVEDDPDVQGALERGLVARGYSVKTAGDGFEALQRLEEEIPDAVLSDIRMPRMDGLELLEKVRSRFPGLPVVLITGHGDLETSVAALRQGAYDYLRKPIGLENLLALLTRLEERRRLEQLLLQERAKLLHASRLATIGTLAAGIAHEINNPTTMVRGNLQIFQLLWKRVEPALRRLCAAEQDPNLETLLGEFPGLVDNMLSGTERIAKIANQVKLHARLEEDGPFHQLDLARCLDDALVLTEPSLKRVRVKKHYTKAMVAGVAQELTQVFVNLLHNAGQAIGNQPGGEVAIEMCQGEAGWIRIEIADNGPGIPAHLQERIFDPFFTTKDPGQGTGLGLSICQRIAAEHGGTLTFESRPGEGARFQVRLPRASSRATEQSAEGRKGA